MNRGIRKILTFITLKDTCKFPWVDRTDTNFIAPLRMDFLRCKSTLDSVKTAFNVFRRKSSLGAPDRSRQLLHHEKQ